MGGAMRMAIMRVYIMRTVPMRYGTATHMAELSSAPCPITRDAATSYHDAGERVPHVRGRDAWPQTGDPIRGPDPCGRAICAVPRPHASPDSS